MSISVAYRDEEGRGTESLFVWKYVGEGYAGSIVNADMDILPANAA